MVRARLATCLRCRLRWRRLNGAELLPQVRAGVAFKDGIRVERPEKKEGKKYTKTTIKKRRIAA